MRSLEVVPGGGGRETWEKEQGKEEGVSGFTYSFLLNKPLPVMTSSCLDCLPAWTPKDDADTPLQVKPQANKPTVVKNFIGHDCFFFGIYLFLHISNKVWPLVHQIKITIMESGGELFSCLPLNITTFNWQLPLFCEKQVCTKRSPAGRGVSSPQSLLEGKEGATSSVALKTRHTLAHMHSFETLQYTGRIRLHPVRGESAGVFSPEHPPAVSVACQYDSSV